MDLKVFFFEAIGQYIGLYIFSLEWTTLSHFLVITN
jgi:hypothetical protein